MAEVFELKKSDYKRFITDEDKTWSVLNFFNIKLNVKTAMLRKPVLYIVVGKRVTEEGKVLGTVSYYNELPYHFNLSDKRSLIETKLGGSEIMFPNHRIKDVLFADINDVALEVQVEKMAKKMEGVTIKKKKDTIYLVSEGDAIELKGEEFKKMIKDFMIGKTQAEVAANTSMREIIEGMGLVDEVILKKGGSDLSAIFK